MKKLLTLILILTLSKFAFTQPKVFDTTYKSLSFVFYEKFTDSLGVLYNGTNTFNFLTRNDSSILALKTKSGIDLTTDIYAGKRIARLVNPDNDNVYITFQAFDLAASKNFILGLLYDKHYRPLEIAFFDNESLLVFKIEKQQINLEL